MTRIGSFARAMRSKTARLTMSYLAVIMTLSVGFSVVLYFASASELNKQLEPPTSTRVHLPASGQQDGVVFSTNPSQSGDGAATTFLQQRVGQSKRDLVLKLVLLNVGMLFVGTGLGYALARRTLRPIEVAIDMQSQFASNASHELRTPLAAMQVEIEQGLRTLTLTAPAKRLLQSNLEELAHLTQLSEGLLRLAREAEAIELAPVWADDISSQAMNRLVKRAQAKRMKIIDSVPHMQLRANGKSLLEVLVILLDNAIKYCPPGTTVHIKGSHDKKFGYVSVHDEGPGLTDQDIAHIFDRFYRGSTTATGHGLGLSIAQTLVNQQHGQLWAQNRQSGGAAFTAKLPFYRGK